MVKGLYKKAKVVRHLKGFRVFLSPGEIKKMDEYQGADPYAVDTWLDSVFHRDRIETTIMLVKFASSLGTYIPRFLDLGCGQGHITGRICESVRTESAAGLDCSLTAIEYAHEAYPGIEFAVGNALELPYSSGFFDIVVVNNLWEHVPNPVAMLNGIRRVMKPGGHVIISTPNRYRLGNILRLLRGKPVSFMSKSHITEYTTGQVWDQIKACGFHPWKSVVTPVHARGFRAKVARVSLAGLFKVLRSDHKLGETAFFLASKE